MAVVVTHSTVATLPDEPGAEVNKAEWNAEHTIVGLATVAGTGAYSDLTGTPTLGTAAAANTTDFDAAGAAAAVAANAVNDGDAAGGDLAGTYPNPTVTQARGLRETAGPTTLAMGAVADGEFLKRSGSTVIGGNPGASSLTLTTTEVDLGTGARSGKFSIAGVGLTTGKAVLIVQASGPYTNKGTLTDEAEMDDVSVSGKVISSIAIECFWKSQTFVRGNFKFDYVVSA